MGKFRQNLANVIHFEIWALIRIFQISRNEKKSQRNAHGFGRHMQNVPKKFNFFSCQNRLPKVSRNRFIAFFDHFKQSNYVHKNFLKKVQNGHLSSSLNFRSLFVCLFVLVVHLGYNMYENLYSKLLIFKFSSMRGQKIFT